MTQQRFIAMDTPDWTPQQVPLLASITEFENDAWQFDTMTEAVLTLFVLETEVPKLTRGMNFIPTPVHVPDPQTHLPL
jgi:hypothetical protein